MSPRKEIFKRIIDVGIVLCSAPITIPTVLASAALVSIGSHGGPFFTQERVGKNGRRFRLVKLRTMVANAENLGAGIYAEPGDSRFTKIGNFLRKTSLDELPQLFNVLRGEMSIVGPRPQLPVITEQYSWDYKTILQVKPGLTGLAQVNGRNNLVRSERLRFDRTYVETWSLLGDFSIMLRTFLVLATGEGQRNDQSAADVEK